MSQELLYTSAPRGLKPGSRGFCTVATTRGMTTWLVERLESLSGYRHVFLPNDPQTDSNPVMWSHLRVPAGGKQYDVLSRVGAYGLDYSSRTNKLAHHVVVESGEQTEAGPAWLLSNPGALQSDWDGEVQALPHGRSLPQGSLACTVCQTWARLTGDAGWAGVVAESFLADPHRLVYLVFEPGQDLLPLLVEVQSLLPPAVRWQVTFSTYYTGLPQDIPCVWRCVLKGSEEARMARRFPQSLQIDLTTPLQTAAGGALVEAARTGILPVAAAVVTVDQSIDPEEPQVESPELPLAAKKQAAKPGEYGLQGEFAVEGGPPPIQPALRRQEKTKQRRREKRLWGGLASAAILLVAVTTYFWWNSRGGGTAGNPRLVAQQEVSGKASRPKRQKPRPETLAADVSDQTEGQDASPKDDTPLPVGQAMASAGNGGTPPKDGAGDGRETEMAGRGISALRNPPEKAKDSGPATPEATTTSEVVPEASKPPQDAPNKKKPEAKPGAEKPKPQSGPVKTVSTDAEDTGKPSKDSTKPPELAYLELPASDSQKPIEVVVGQINGDPNDMTLEVWFVGKKDPVPLKMKADKRGLTWNVDPQKSPNESLTAVRKPGISHFQAASGTKIENRRAISFLGKNVDSSILGAVFIMRSKGETTAFTFTQPEQMNPLRNKANINSDLPAVQSGAQLELRDIVLTFDGKNFSDWKNTASKHVIISDLLEEYLKLQPKQKFDELAGKSLEFAAESKNSKADFIKWLADCDRMIRSYVDVTSDHKIGTSIHLISTGNNLPNQWICKFITNGTNPKINENIMFYNLFSNSIDKNSLFFRLQTSVNTIKNSTGARKGSAEEALGNTQNLLREPLEKWVIKTTAERFKSQATIVSGRIVTQVGPYEVDVVRIGTEEPASPLKASEPEAGK